ncbi:MFS transporter [Streptomyces sp. WMMB303]|uniref:MFS transporter n=1 Tax=Streptomyces sp. WMMB303 TaxID=3034154 RepID=UPI0023ED2FDE|nr:MFS transporter [Streptomyces sp. WMMB303]MDF4254558.1 MFS transporter [Streptomyces sp. WMMB303]
MSRKDLALRWSRARQFAPLTWVLTSTLTGSMGYWMLTIIVPWFVVSTTGSGSHAGSAFAAEVFPGVVVRFLAGPVVDRFGLRRTSWIGTGIQTLAFVAIAALVAMNALSFPVLLVLLAVSSASSGAALAAKKGLAPAAARHVGVEPKRGISLATMTTTASLVLGALLGGFLVPMPAVALVVAAALFAADTLIVGLALPHGMEPKVHLSEGKLGYWRSLGEGIGYFRRARVLIRLQLMLCSMEFLVAPMAGVFLPMWARETGKEAPVIALLFSAAAFAGLAGSIAAVYLVERVRPAVLMSVGYLLIVPQPLVLALNAPTWVVVVSWASAGFAGAFPFAVVGRIVYQWPPEKFRMRVTAISGSTARAGGVIGGLLAGGLVDRFGLTVPLIVAAVLYFLATQGTVLRKEMRALTPEIREDHPMAEAPVEEPVV